MLRFELTAEEIRSRPYWVVSLSNGKQVFQCDEDEQGNFVNSWRELKSYVEANLLDITDFWLRFRDHSEEIAVGKDGHFFVYSVLAEAFSGVNRYFYNCGYLENEKVFTKKWLIPEVLSLEEEIRETDSGGMKELLILNQNVQEFFNFGREGLREYRKKGSL